jgi:5-methylcytosine-specific restriction protein A
MARAMKVCSCVRCDAHEGSCPEIVAAGRCTACDTAADKRRGTSADRGYGTTHRNQFRRAVLRRDPICVCTDTAKTEAHNHGARCYAASTVADHDPLDKRELIRLGLNSNDPRYGRGLCASCHSRETAANPAQRGGWNVRPG